jgi:hypothetical protein
VADQEYLHKCDHVVRVVGTKRRKVRCLRPGAMPMITRSLLDVGPRYPQPRWLCSVHWPRHEEVRFDGKPQEQRPFPGTLIHKIKLKAVS